MTIKKKIRLSNILTVLIPIAFTAIVITVCLNTSLGSYWNTLVSLYSDENGVQFAHSIMANYQQELWEFNWVECGKEDDSGRICSNEKMTSLGNALSELGYHFMITKDGEQLYSNLSDEEMQTGREVAGEALDHAKTLTASRYEVAVIKNTFWYGDKIFCITAIHPKATDGEAVAYMQKYFLRYICGIIVFFVVLTMIINGILSWWISGSILKPLRLLSDGTKKIREGNLEEPMSYYRADEFGNVCRDFDDMRAYLQESVRQRLEDEKSRKDLITGISHDLRTPLTSISGYLDGLLDGIADTPQKQERYLQAIKTRTKTMVNLIESLSEYSRLDRNFRYHMTVVNLKEYIEKYIEANQIEAEQNRVNITFSCNHGKYPVELDEKEFKRVFDNLLTNTAKYRIRDASRVLISIKHSLDTYFVELVFQDDGPGVPEESLGQLFDSFYRVDDSRNKMETGSGIGLAVVREIVQGHGGKVWAENRNGLAIIINLPICHKGQEEK